MTDPLEPVDPPLPRFLQVEVTSACNLRCHMCAVRYRPAVNKTDGAMSLELYRRLVDELPHPGEVVLQGLGEPLLAPDLVAMVAHAKLRGAVVGFNCNGTLLTRKNCTVLVEAGLDWIAVSLDGATAETYESIRDGARFERVARGIRTMSDVRRDRRSTAPAMRLVFVAMRRNVAELADLVRLAAELGVERVAVQNLSHDFSDCTQYPELAHFTATEALWNGVDSASPTAFDEARAVAAQLGVRLDLPKVEERRGPAELPGCRWPWTGAYVTSSGVVQPCCMVMGDERVSMGSVAHERFAEVWKGQAYQEFRAALVGDEPPAVCRGCSLYHGVF